MLPVRMPSVNALTLSFQQIRQEAEQDLLPDKLGFRSSDWCIN